MSNIINIPKAAVLRFYDPDRVGSAQYATRFMEDFTFTDMIRDYEEKKEYCQKWQKNDTIIFQFSSNVAQHQFNIRDQYNQIVQTVTPTLVSTLVQSNVDFYEAKFVLSSLPTGYYWVEWISGIISKNYQRTDGIWIDDIIANSVFIEFTNSTNDFDIAFDSGSRFGFRVEGVLQEFAKDDQRKVYADQNLDNVLLSAFPFASYSFVVGDAEGVPSWVSDLVISIFACDGVMIDGRGFVRPESSKIEYARESLYPMVSFKFTVYESDNKYSKEVEFDDTPLSGRIFFGTQGNSSDPTDFSRFVDQDPHNDITIPYGNPPTQAWFYWMWHSKDAPQKTNWQDLNELQNAGNIGNQQDLFTVKSFSVDGNPGFLYMTRYKTSFNGNANLKYYIASPQWITLYNPPSDLTVASVTDVASGDTGDVQELPQTGRVPGSSWVQKFTLTGIPLAGGIYTLNVMGNLVKVTVPDQLAEGETIENYVLQQMVVKINALNIAVPPQYQPPSKITAQVNDTPATELWLTVPYVIGAGLTYAPGKAAELQITFVAPVPPAVVPTGYTIRAFNVELNTTEYFDVDGSPATITVKKGYTYKIAVRSNFTYTNSVWTSVITQYVP